MTSISIGSGVVSHRQAWTRQLFFERRRFVCLMLCAMFVDVRPVYRRRRGFRDKQFIACEELHEGGVS